MLSDVPDAPQPMRPIRRCLGCGTRWIPAEDLFCEDCAHNWHPDGGGCLETVQERARRAPGIPSTSAAWRTPPGSAPSSGDAEAEDSL